MLEEQAAQVDLGGRPNKGGKGTILFVDDEISIVSTTKMLLEEFGFNVVDTTSPLHALELVKSGKHQFDLVITDLTMPRMTGIELSKHLHTMKPSLPVILCTGFNADTSPEISGQDGIRDILIKPVMISELTKKIRKILDGH